MELGKVHLVNCFQALLELDDDAVDHIICDPPYDKEVVKGARTLKGTGHGGPRCCPRFEHGWAPPTLDIPFGHLSDEDLDMLVGEALRVSKRWVVIFCTLEMLGRYREVSGDSWIRAGLWNRLDGAPQFTGDRPAAPAEGIAIMHRPGRKKWNGGGKRGIWTFPICKKDRVHPTQKPLPLMLELIRDFTDPEDLVLDPFAGSGTTGVAAVRLGRRFLGFELDPEHAANANQRLEAESHHIDVLAAKSGQQGLF